MAKTNSYGKRPLWQWIVLYVVIGIIVYGGIYYFFRNKNGGYNYPTSQSQNTAPTESQTANWKTYTNTTYGFSLQYPSGWFINEQSAAKSGRQTMIYNVAFNSCDITTNKYCTNTKGQFSGSVNIEYPYLKSVEEFYNTSGEQGASDKKNTTIDGKPAIVFSYVTQEATGMWVYAAFIKNGDKIYRLGIGTGYQQDSVQAQNLFNQILATFKFTQ